MDDKRASARRRVMLGALALFNERRSSVDCTVRSLSETGARLTVGAEVSAVIPRSFDLSIQHGPPRRVSVAWRDATNLGVTFD